VQGDAVGDEHFVVVGIAMVNPAIRDMCDLQTQTRPVIELIGGIDAEPKLERAAQVRPVTPAIDSDCGERRHHETIERDIAVKTAIALNATPSVHDHADRRPDVVQLLAIAELDPPLARRHGAAVDGDIEDAHSEVEIAGLLLTEDG
jgi:hypothetical protein